MIPILEDALATAVELLPADELEQLAAYAARLFRPGDRVRAEIEALCRVRAPANSTEPARPKQQIDEPPVRGGRDAV